MRDSLAERMALYTNRLYLGLYGDSLYGSDHSVLLAWAYRPYGSEYAKWAIWWFTVRHYFRIADYNCGDCSRWAAVAMNKRDQESS